MSKVNMTKTSPQRMVSASKGVHRGSRVPANVQNRAGRGGSPVSDVRAKTGPIKGSDKGVG